MQCFEKLFGQLPPSAADFTYGPSMVAEDPNYGAWCSLQSQTELNLQKLRFFTEDIMPDRPDDKTATHLLTINCVKFYLKFTPDLWASIPSEEKRTNNDTESNSATHLIQPFSYLTS